MERPGDEPPDVAPEVIEEEETQEIIEPGRLDGRRIAVGAGLFFAGAACVAAAFVATSDEAMKIIALVGGIFMMLAAYLGVISKGFKLEASKEHFKADGEIPVGQTKTTVKKTKVGDLSVSKSLVVGRSPPKQGIMPPVAGHMPPKEQAGLSSSGADADENGSNAAARAQRDSARLESEGTPPDPPSSATP